MSDINLLPDDLRGKEEKELRSVRKKPKRISIDMSSPGRDVVKQPLKQSKPSLMSRLFSRNTKPGAVLDPQGQDEKTKSFDKPERDVEKRINIPQSSGSSDSSAPKKESAVATEVEKPKERENKRGASFETGSGKESEVKFSERKEKVTEDIGKAPKVKKSGNFLANLLGALFSRRARSKKEKKPKVSRAEKKKEEKRKDDEDSEVREVHEGRLDVNLIPAEMDQHLEFELGKRVFSTITVLIASALVVAGGYLGLTWYQVNTAYTAQEVEEEIREVDAMITSLETNRREALEFQRYLALVNDLLANHVYWSNFFDQLEEYTAQDVYFTNFSMSGTDSLVIAAVAQDYEALAKQLVIFQQADDFIKNVRINSANALIDGEQGSYSGVSFTVNLEFIPGVFLNSSAEN